MIYQAQLINQRFTVSKWAKLVIGLSRLLWQRKKRQQHQQQTSHFIPCN